MGGDDAAREVADRIFVWGTILGVILACVQWFALPRITPWFSPLAEVREAVKGPAAISSFIHLVNGLVFGKFFGIQYPSLLFLCSSSCKELTLVAPLTLLQRGRVRCWGYRHFEIWH